MPEVKPRWDWLGAFFEAEATGRPIRPPDDTPLREAALGVSEAAKRMLGGIARSGVSFVPYVGDPADLALTWKEGGYGDITAANAERFAKENWLAMIPFVGRLSPKYLKKLKDVLGIELPGVVRLARIQHADDPVFATHSSRRLVFTVVDDPEGVNPASLLPDHASYDPRFVKRVADVAIENPVFVLPANKAKERVNPTLVARYVKILNPRLATTNTWAATGFPAHGVPVEDIAEFTRNKGTMREMFRFPEGREHWDKLTRSEKADLLDAWRRGIWNAEARGGITRPNLIPGTTAIMVTPDNLVSSWAQRHGFDAVIAIGPKLRPGRKSMFDITEIALVPNKRKLVTRSDGQTVDLMVREPLRVY